jgi:SAM-dependent methyltransferase
MGDIYRPDGGWAAYFDAVAGRPPCETLLDALERFDREEPRGASRPLLAADVGCGEGRDTIELLRRGWHVLAVDNEPEGLRRLEARTPAEARPRLRTLLASYEDLAPEPIDLLNASFSIPHCREGVFDGMWDRLTAAVRPGGRFAGQLFGDRDDWTGPGAVPDPGWRGGRQHHTREQVEGLLARAGLVAETMREQEEDGRTALGRAKHWHLFHIVARKR